MHCKALKTCDELVSAPLRISCFSIENSLSMCAGARMIWRSVFASTWCFFSSHIFAKCEKRYKKFVKRISKTIELKAERRSYYQSKSTKTHLTRKMTEKRRKKPKKKSNRIFLLLILQFFFFPVSGTYYTLVSFYLFTCRLLYGYIIRVFKSKWIKKRDSVFFTEFILISLSLFFPS